MRETLRRLAGRFGFEVTKGRQRALTGLIRKYQIDHVIDVGANEGQFSRLIRSSGFDGPITAFEPIEELASKLADDRLTVFPFAVGRERGNVDFNIYESADFSSSKQLSSRYSSEYASAPKVASIRNVALTTLDEHRFEGSRLLLKIDTQGTELDVLHGAARTLDRTALLYVECPFLNIYEGGCTAGQIIDFAASAGFFPARFFANSITRSGAWVDGDVVFVKRADA